MLRILPQGGQGQDHAGILCVERLICCLIQFSISLLYVASQIRKIICPGAVAQRTGPGLRQYRPLTVCRTHDGAGNRCGQVVQHFIHNGSITGSVSAALLQSLQGGFGVLQHAQVGDHVLSAELADIVRVRLSGGSDGRFALQGDLTDGCDLLYHRQCGFRIAEGVVSLCHQGLLRLR